MKFAIFFLARGYVNVNWVTEEFREELNFPR